MYGDWFVGNYFFTKSFYYNLDYTIIFDKFFIGIFIILFYYA